MNGKVTIHGKVKTADEKAKAESVVKQLEGVKEVQNLLQVVPESAKDAVEASDDTIEEAVEATLESDQALKDVKVASVNKGVVLLSGFVQNRGQALRAAEIAAGVQGVIAVKNALGIRT